MPPSLSHHIAIPEWIWKGQYLAICSLLTPPSHTLSGPHTSHLCTITDVFAYTYLNAHDTRHLPFLQASWHLFLWSALFCWHQSPFQGSLFYLRRRVISLSLSPLSYCTYMAKPHTCPPLCSTHHGNTSFKCTFFFLKPGQLLSVHHYRQILDAKEKKKGKDNEKQWQEQLANQYNVPFLCEQSAPAVGPLSWEFRG